MDPNQIQNTLNSLGGQAPLGHNMQANQLAQNMTGQYNPQMQLFQQQYLNFTPFANYSTATANQQIFQPQQYQFMQQMQSQTQQMQPVFQQQSSQQQQVLQTAQHQLSQQLSQQILQQQQQQQQLLQQQQQQQQLLQQQQQQLQQQQHQRLYEEQCRQMEEQRRKENEEAARIQRQRELEEAARQRELQEQAEKERLELLRQQEEEARKAEEERIRAEQERIRAEQERIRLEQERIEKEKLIRIREDEKRKRDDANKTHKEMIDRVNTLGRPLTLVATHFLPNYVAMLPFPYESAATSRSSSVCADSSMRQLLEHSDQATVAAISHALSQVDVDDITTRLDKLCPMEKETNDLFLDQLPPLIQAVVSYDTNALDVDSHNNLQLLENEDQIMQEDLVRPGPSSVLIQAEVASQKAMMSHHMAAISEDVPPTTTPIDEQASSPNGASPLYEGRDSIQCRRQMASVGKQPKAGGGGNQRKKRDMVESLYDSLTGYFDPSDGRRRRLRNKNSEDDEESLKRDLELIAAMEAGEQLPTCVTGLPAEKINKEEDKESSEEDEAKFFEKKGKKRKREVIPERPPTPTEVISARDAEWSERQRLKNERKKRKGDDSENGAWNTDALAENDSFVRFNTLLDSVFEQVEDFDLTSLAAGGKRSKPKEHEDDETDEEEEVNSDLLIDRSTLDELRRESQKLKNWQKLNKVHFDRLVKFMTILERNIRDVISSDGQRLLVAIIDEETEEDDAVFREVVDERLLRAIDAACTALIIMTSHKMHKQVLLEDTIERAISLCNQYLNYIVYPSSDSMFKSVSSKKKAPAEEPRRKKRQGANTRTPVQQIVYLRISDIFSCFAELVRVQTLPDSQLHHLASMSISTFFVSNVGELQVQALRLASNIFAKSDDQIRFSMMNDVLNSLHRLPHGKNANTSYRLGSDQWMSNTTALVMQLVQSVVKMPKVKKHDEEEENGKTQINPDAVVKDSFAIAHKITGAFLAGFLAKCSMKGNKLEGEEDYRRLFDQFLQDLLLALYRPEWPAAEMILTNLGALLVKYFRSRQTDMTIRQACLEYLGSITARLRRDMRQATDDSGGRLELVVKTLIFEEDEDDNYDSVDDVDISRLSTTDRLKKLEQALIDYLIDKKGDSDVSVEYAVMFYVGEWFKETAEDLEMARQNHKERMAQPDLTDKERRKLEKKMERISEKGASMKDFLTRLVDKKQMRKRAEMIKNRGSVLMESDALWAVKYLAQNREFSHSFEQYLKHIVFGAGQETVVGLRTRALKCLTLIIESDHEVLMLEEVRSAVHNRLVDPNAQVREAAIELLGKFVLVKEEYIAKYYDLIVVRILDSGVAVRKRIVRIMREICERYPDFEKIPEMLSRMVRRVNDEEGVKKLVYETFSTLWFQPTSERCPEVLVVKVLTMTAVVQNCIVENTVEFLEQLVHALLKQGDRGVLLASRQIVDALVDNVLNLENKLANENTVSGNEKDDDLKSAKTLQSNQERRQACLTTLAIFSKVRPDLMVRHAETLKPYLSETNIKSLAEMAVMNEVIGMLERVVPLMGHPDDVFLSRIDQDLKKLGAASSIQLVYSSISCAAAIWNRFHRITPGFIASFKHYMVYLSRFKTIFEGNPAYQVGTAPNFKRALFSLGVLSRFFDFDELIPEEEKKSMIKEYAPNTNFDSEGVNISSLMRDNVFQVLEFFSNDSFSKNPHSLSIREKAITSLGHFCAQYSEYLTLPSVVRLYTSILTSSRKEMLQLQILCLRNLEMFLQNEEKKMIRSNDEWDKNKDQQNLKEMELSHSGLGSTVIQKYQDAVLDSYFDGDVTKRQAASQVMWLTMAQGLLTPGKVIPTLIAMTTDPLQGIRNRIENTLKEIDAKYGGMVQSKAMEGFRKAFSVQRVIRQEEVVKGNTSAAIVRGIRYSDFSLHNNSQTARDQFALPKLTNDGQAMLSGLYTSLRTNRQQRRSFLHSTLKLFSEDSREKLSLSEWIFVADNVAMFPYQMLDEPLYVIRMIDQIVAQSGQSIINQFKEVLVPATGPQQDDDDVLFEVDNLCRRFPQDKTPLYELMVNSQSCFILLYIRNFLIKLYGLTEAKVQEYSPSEAAKVYEKAVSRRNTHMFNPMTALEELLPQNKQDRATYDGQLKLATKIYKFRKMLLTLDKGDADQEEEESAAREVEDEQTEEVEEDE